MPILGRWLARRKRKIRLTGVATPFGGVTFEVEAGESENIRKLLIYLEDRVVLSRNPPADGVRLLSSMQKVSAAVTEALQAIPPDSSGVGPLEAIRTIAREGYDGPLPLLRAGEIRGGIGAQLAELAARYKLPLPEGLASLAGSSAALDSLRELESKARERAEGPRDAKRGYPDDLLYHEGHGWVLRSGNGVIVGITEWAQDAIGEVVFVDLPDPGTSVAQGETLAEIETVKCMWDLQSPLTGSVLKTNPWLNERPNLVNDDPYVAGWIAELQPSSENDLSDLLDAELYQELLVDQ
jgi:glycine cleavage system H protein